MPDLPMGTVTFLFTDIEGSTRLLHELGADGYSEALTGHRRALRKAFAEHGGVEVDTQGDAFFVAFADATGALAAAANAQRALPTGPIRVRMGLHTGTPRLTDEGYVGHDVHLGARIAAAGHGGQVLLSKRTRDAAGDSLETLDLGEHRVKDFAEPVWIYQLGAERFPPLKTISNTNLPRPPSSFVGRERELEELTSLLRNGARLVSLTGPGGTGKTRLSLEAAEELVPEFKSGVFWVDLAPLREPALVPETIAQTLGAKDGLADHIGEREMLLVLDNLEQVVEAAPDLAKLLEACPNLRLLVTSRERLRVRGEVEYAVRPLTEAEAVDLFSQRAALTADATIAELCRRLDNLPLAVELAAARTSILSPAQILERLAKRLDLLKGGRDAAARQQTLRATIEWSYELLTDDEKQLYARMSVFSGGSTLEAAEEIADADLDKLQSLVDKSLVRHTDERFWMLETIREYATERMVASGEADTLTRRHAEHFLALAVDAEPHLRLFSAGWVDRLERDYDNFRAALDTLMAGGDHETALRLAGALADFWVYGGHVAEGATRIENALARFDGPTPARLKALLGAADLAYSSGNLDLAESRASEGLELSRRLGDGWSAAYALNLLGATLIERGDFEDARRHEEEAVELFRASGDHAFTAAATRTLAWVHHSRGDLETARKIHERNLEHVRASGLKETEVDTLGSLAMIAVALGNLDEAASLARQNAMAARELGSAHSMAQALGRAAEVLAAARRSPQAAAKLLGCFDALREELGVSEPWVARANQKTLELLKQQLDEQALTDARAIGEAMSLEHALDLALEALGASAGPSAS